MLSWFLEETVRGDMLREWLGGLWELGVLPMRDGLGGVFGLRALVMRLRGMEGELKMMHVGREVFEGDDSFRSVVRCDSRLK